MLQRLVWGFAPLLKPTLDHIVFGGTFFATARGFEDEGDAACDHLAGELAKPGGADGTCADIAMAVNAASDALLRVIKMDQGDVLPSDEAFELRDVKIDGIGCGEIDPGGEDMARVNANFDTFFLGVREPIIEGGELFQAGTELGALARRGFQYKEACGGLDSIEGVAHGRYVRIPSNDTFDEFEHEIDG